MIDRPFRVGDRIRLLSGENVVVKDIGIRRSKFVFDDDKAIIIMPNQDLSKSKIVNYTFAEENSNES
ncbi:MAG: mechanosensitive ion channel [Candidatus Ancaeobacter aquaticus]|nr:mechanosensitive ion channel [Candidatus Ancaeobacter aquaticus]